MEPAPSVSHLLQLKKVIDGLLMDPLQTAAIDRTAELMVGALTLDRKIFLFGNGGSAADAQHIAAEIVGRFRVEREGLPALALTTDTSVITAIANDYGYDEIFRRQLEAWGRPGDVAIGISTSGKSRNVVKALDYANYAHILTIGLTGMGGGEVFNVADTCIVVPSRDTAHVQECHIAIGHILCEAIDLNKHIIEGDSPLHD